MALLNSSIQWLVILLIGLSVSSCIPIHALWLGRPDKQDAKRFKSKTLAVGNNAYSFAESTQSYGTIKVNDWTSDVPVFKTLRQVLSEHQCNGFMIVQNDTILYEDYFRGKTTESLLTSYSVAKSFVSLCLGIALEKKWIKSTKEPIINYLPQLDPTKGISSVTIRDLLNHTSGIQQKLSIDAHLYYGSIQKSLKYIEIYRKPGTHQEYLNINTQLLAMLIESASGKSIDQVFQEEIWSKIGAENTAYWSVDRRDDIIKAFCCFNATLRDYAKIGQLIYNNGRKGTKQIIPTKWLESSFARDTSRGSSFNYNASWHLGIDAYKDIMAIGLYKQYIYIHPAKKITIVLFNDREEKLKEEMVDWIYIFRQIVDQL